MELPFLNRNEELARLDKALSGRESALLCLYGRRRCGKSRLLQESLQRRPAVYYVGDDRESVLQRGALASAIGRLAPGFDRVTYPDWEALLARWRHEAPAGAILALDEFPSLVNASRELPSLLQKLVDHPRRPPLHLVLCGSSQSMMQGLVLDASAPLYGRAREILRIRPLPAHWISRALRLRNPGDSLEAYATWGGVPRYWELAADYGSLWEAARFLVLDPLGPLHNEPRRLLLDDTREITQPASILALAGRGCRRVSEIAARLEKPASSLARPLQRLLELELLKREVPFGAPERDNKRSFYSVADPFLGFWFRYIEPNRSRLEARQIAQVEREIRQDFPMYLGQVWEELARASVARLEIAGRRWLPASRWWGAGADRRPVEIDVVAESEDRAALLIGEAKLTTAGDDWPRIQNDLARKAAAFPLAGNREIVFCLWRASAGKTPKRGIASVSASAVFSALR